MRQRAFSSSFMIMSYFSCFFFYIITGELSKRAIHMCVSILSGIEDFVRERVWNFFENIRYDMEGREAYL